MLQNQTPLHAFTPHVSDMMGVMLLTLCVCLCSPLGHLIGQKCARGWRSDFCMILQHKCLVTLKLVKFITRIKHHVIYHLPYNESKRSPDSIMLSLTGNLSVIHRKSTFSLFSSHSLCQPRFFPETRH